MRSGSRAARLLLASVALACVAVEAAAGPHGDIDPEMVRRMDAAFGERFVRLTADGKEVELEGALTTGTADALRAALDAAPHVKVVRLNSPGGWLDEARELRALFRERGLTTFSSHLCAFACAIAFMGGKERLVEAGTLFAFHGGKSASGNEPAHDSDREEIEALVADGVPRSFAERAYSIPHTEYWYPSTRELLEAQVVTRIVGPGEFPLLDSGSAVLVAHYWDMLLPDERLRMLHEALPGLVEVMRRLLSQSAEERLTPEAVRWRVRPEMQGAARRVIATASDASARKYTAIALEEVETLFRADPRTCVDYIETPNDYEGSFTRVLPAPLLERDTDNLYEVITSALLRPQKAPTAAEFEDAVVAMRRLPPPPRKPDDIDRSRARTVAEQDCLFVIDLYRAMLRLPERQTSFIVRGMPLRDDE